MSLTLVRFEGKGPWFAGYRTADDFPAHGFSHVIRAKIQEGDSASHGHSRRAVAKSPQAEASRGGLQYRGSVTSQHLTIQLVVRAVPAHCDSWSIVPHAARGTRSSILIQTL